MNSFDIQGTADLPVVASRFLEAAAGCRVIAFYGQMGAGKTTFITALCRALGVEDVVNSPTFTIVNEYACTDGMPVYHFDFYRVERLQEARDLGFEEYLYGDGLCLIEWPENVEELLPPDCLRVRIEVTGDTSRRLIMESPEPDRPGDNR